MKILLGLIFFAGIAWSCTRFPAPVLAYAVGITLFTYIIFAVDKFSAVKGWWRVAEKTLFFYAALGGSLGILAGELTFGHKRSKAPFNRVFYSILVAQLLIVSAVVYFFRWK